MRTLYLAFFYILMCIFTTKNIQAYTRCTKPDTSKTAYGFSCSSDSQCLTEYCNPTAGTCSCPSGSFIDTVSGLCVKNIGYSFTSYSGECGYLVSPDSMNTGSLSSWTIYGASRTYITIVVLDIDMDSTSCSTNYLEIYEGSTRLLNKTCDRSNSTLRFHASNSSILTVSYRKPVCGYRGFRAIYYTRDLSSVLYESKGYIVSPGYPVSYVNDMSRSWLISAELGRIISAIFLIDTESCCDYVKVYDGRNVNSASLANFSGSLSLGYVRSSANYMFILFTTDYSGIHTGFRASYKLYVLYGYSCSSSDECVGGLVCTRNICTCLSNQYYDSSTKTCKLKISHAETCSTTEQCLTPYECRNEIYINTTCLCPINMFHNTWNCLDDSSVQAAVSSSSIIKTDSILLKWTTQTWKTNFFFTVEWDGTTFYPNSSELYVDGLSPGRTYNFTITTNIPADDYYSYKSFQTIVSLATKQAPGFACSNYDKCSDESSCVNGFCVCLNQFYLSKLSRACEPRLAKGYECPQTDECKETLTCISGRCGCLSGYYYDTNRKGCYSALKDGQSCDPSIENICELPHLICSRENTSITSYTCQRDRNTNDTNDADKIVSDDNASEDNNTVYIAVAVVGWVAALAAVITVIVLCSRNRKKSSTNGILETQTITAMSDLRGSNDSTVPPKNDYKPFPTSTDVQATTSTPDVSQVQTTVPALSKSNIKPSSKPVAPAKTTKPSISAQPSFGHVNRTYRPDSPDSDEGTYEEISHVGHVIEDTSDQLYQNVRVPKENEYCNSNI